MSELQSLKHLLGDDSPQSEDDGRTSMRQLIADIEADGPEEEPEEPTAPYWLVTFKDGQQFTIEVTGQNRVYKDSQNGFLVLGNGILINPEALAILQFIAKEEEPEPIISAEPIATPIDPAFVGIFQVPQPRP